MGDCRSIVLKWLLLVWAHALVQGAVGSLVGAAVLPHGDFAFDPSLLAGIGSSNEVAEAQALHKGMLETADFIAGLKPDVILLTTPHGLQSSWDWVFYGNSRLQGRATVGRDLEESFAGSGFPRYEVSFTAQGAPELAAELVSALADAGANATLLKGWNDVLPQELHWGEVLPLEFLRRAAKNALPPILPIGLPLSRYNHSSSVAKGTLEMGRILGHALGRSQVRRTALVVSTDLAHRHWPNTTFGFSPDAEPFDVAMGKWASTLDANFLLKSDTLSKVDHIYSCGYLGMVLLQGVLESVGGNFTPSLTARATSPTYYGMMAASFSRTSSHDLEKPGSAAELQPRIVV